MRINCSNPHSIFTKYSQVYNTFACIFHHMYLINLVHTSGITLLNEKHYKIEEIMSP